MSTTFFVMFSKLTESQQCINIRIRHIVSLLVHFSLQFGHKSDVASITAHDENGDALLWQSPVAGQIYLSLSPNKLFENQLEVHKHQWTCGSTKRTSIHYMLRVCTDENMVCVCMCVCEFGDTSCVWREIQTQRVRSSTLPSKHFLFGISVYHCRTPYRLNSVDALCTVVYHDGGTCCCRWCLLLPLASP